MKPGFGQNRPLHSLTFPLGRSTTLRSFVGGVLPTEVSKGHNTPGRAQPSHDTVSYVVGLALVFARIGEIRCTAAVQLYPLHRRSVSSGIRAASLGNLSRQKSWCKTLMKSPKIDRVLVYTDKEGIPGWWTSGFMSPTAQSACDAPQKSSEMWTKNTAVF